MVVSLGEVFETIANNIEPDAPAVFCDGEILSWSELDRASNALGHRLIAAGLNAQSKVGLYLRNGPDYLIGVAACLKARLCPFNINYRYGSDEISYLLDNADCEALLFDAEFASVVTDIKDPGTIKIKLVGRGTAPDAEELSTVYQGNSAPIDNIRDPDDILMVYTGGTTGLPKGVMWTMRALWANLLPGLTLPNQRPPDSMKALGAQIRSGEGRLRFNIAAPLMHGTGLFSALGILFRGSSLVLSGRPSFDPVEIVTEVQDLRCDGLVIVGDAFARPILDVLQAEPDKYDVSHVRAVVSSGMMWSPEVKLGLLEHMPNASLVDGLGASESSGLATSVTTRDNPPGEARFELTGSVVLHPDDLTPVRPGSGEIGILAKGGPQPLGYYKDPERTAATYVEIDGERYVLGGDHATVELDGSIRLLGRGSHCINTAGEKVYPEEVEQSLKTHRAVSDALVFGVADRKFGQSVAAVASVSEPVEIEDLIVHVRSAIASYKAPRRLVLVDEVPRAPNGKADYQSAKDLFEAKMPKS